MKRKHEAQCAICFEPIEEYHQDINQCKTCFSNIHDDCGISCDKCGLRNCMECNNKTQGCDFNLCDNCGTKCFCCGRHLSEGYGFKHKYCKRWIHEWCADSIDGEECEPCEQIRRVLSLGEKLYLRKYFDLDVITVV